MSGVRTMKQFFSEPLVRPDGITEIRRLEDDGLSWDDILRMGYQWKHFIEVLAEYHIVRLSERAYVFATPHEYGVIDPENVQQHSFGDSVVKDLTWHSDEMIHFGLSCILGSFRGTAFFCSIAGADAEPVSEFQALFRLRETSSDIVQFTEIGPYDVEDDEPIPYMRFDVSAGLMESMLKIFKGRRVEFLGQSLTEDQCQKLAVHRGSLGFQDCSFADRGQAIFDAFGNDQGTTDLTFWSHDQGVDIDAECLFANLRSTTSLHQLQLYDVAINVSELMSAVSQNRSLVWFNQSMDWVVTNEEWHDFFRALRTHPTLEWIRCKGTVIVRYEGEEEGEHGPLRRAQAIADMLKYNETLQRLQGDVWEDSELVDQTFMQYEVETGLKFNRMRPRVATFMKCEPFDVRRRMLSRILDHSLVNDNPSYIFSLLSKHPDLVEQQSRLGRLEELKEKRRRLLEEAEEIGKEIKVLEQEKEPEVRGKKRRRLSL